METQLLLKISAPCSSGRDSVISSCPVLPLNGSCLISAPPHPPSPCLWLGKVLLHVRAAAQVRKLGHNPAHEEAPGLRRQKPGAVSRVLQCLLRPQPGDPSSWPVLHPWGSSGSFTAGSPGKVGRTLGSGPGSSLHLFGVKTCQKMAVSTLGGSLDKQHSCLSQPLTPLNPASGRKALCCQHSLPLPGVMANRLLYPPQVQPTQAVIHKIMRFAFKARRFQ